MPAQLHCLFAPLDAVGHMNSCIGIAEELMQSRHKCTFVITDQWKGKLVKYGIDEMVLSSEIYEQHSDPAKSFAERLIRDGTLGQSKSIVENHISFWVNTLPFFIERLQYFDERLEDLIPKLKPDIIILDQVFNIPSVIRSGIPWVQVCSLNPLFNIDDPRTPPQSSGLPSNGNNIKEWEEFRLITNLAKQPLREKFNNYLISRGVEPLNSDLYVNHSKYLNIYAYPLELDYLDLRPLPPNWVRFDTFQRYDRHLTFEVPEQLKNKPGKLIYFSMGSMGGADVQLMTRLVSILSKSPNRFIVSKGPGYLDYDLPDNMYGEQMLPQIQVMPIVDLVITHGGNNTFTEAFYFGKPMIVMPLFVDQHDNAQRVDEMGFGVRLDAYQCSEQQLLNAIHKLLNDRDMNNKLREISKRIQTDNSKQHLPKIIENLVNKN
ncbi:NDP-glycosyltransferase YjiC-like [Oppia nitens]|uniref:NDP-glycosyltransferase YjiC-like n=1 Tax=Oppia nitens TaxID=1686743 RepID=UPI0023D986A5|nr:NDP-glycosyltransferase YjiC-like [Oppia nitens]